MSSSFWLSRLLLLGLLVVTPARLFGQEPNPSPKPEPTPESVPAAETAPPVTTPAQIEQQKPKFYVVAQVDRESHEYYEGEQLTLTVKSEEDAYLYVFYTQVDGEVYLVFPNSAQPDNKVKAKQAVQVPGKNDNFRWTVNAPFGKESMKVIASKERVPALEKPELRRKRATQVTQKEVSAAAEDLYAHLPTEKWTEVLLEITTKAGKNPNSPYFGERHAVFFGVHEQWASENTKKVFGSATSDLGLSVLMDVLMMDRCLRARGGLDSSLVIPDFREEKSPRPTKGFIKHIVTEVLPTTTKPGDTVFIFFSGHGAGLADESSAKHEKDRQDEFLLPTDGIGFNDLRALRKTRDELASQQQTLPEPLDGLLERAEKWLADANVVVPSNEDYERLPAAEQDAIFAKARDVLIRNSCVMDDEFGHWVQLLDGRRVVVILDACHSGGFQQEQGDEPGEEDEPTSNQSKSLSRGQDDDAIPFRFNFLKPQIVRLKDLGQGNTALLAAARAGESSIGGLPASGSPKPATLMLADMWKELSELGRLKGEKPADFDAMGLFTYCLVNDLLISPDPVGVKEAWTSCAAQMKSYFASDSMRAENERRRAKGEKPVIPHVPTYYDQSRPGVLLKP
jgi:hypothetical protein